MRRVTRFETFDCSKVGSGKVTRFETFLSHRCVAWGKGHEIRDPTYSDGHEIRDLWFDQGKQGIGGVGWVETQHCVHFQLDI